MNIKKIIIGKQFEDSANLEELIGIVNKKRVKVIQVTANMKISIEKNIYFDVLWPQNYKPINENRLNNNSLVLKLNYIRNDDKFSILFTGDIEKKAEELLINKYKYTNMLNSTILKVAHHGSKTSMAEEFLKLVNPKIALIGVGKKNTFGHPNIEVIERLKKIKCRIYRTDEDGEISILVDKKGRLSINKFIK